MFLGLQDPDPDPLVRGTYWSGSGCCTGSESGSFYHHAKIVNPESTPKCLGSATNDLNIPEFYIATVLIGTPTKRQISKCQVSKLGNVLKPYVLKADVLWVYRFIHCSRSASASGSVCCCIGVLNWIQNKQFGIESGSENQYLPDPDPKPDPK